ncbi:MAG: hypothetical protein A3F11_02455 [Gammaproteobacteria bacterium RIFCSPHIGHO2_12_FULL_37_14]|nr:MAG: hypothetical protein A3F11_02455 [Gammaproteobacteria bacterium RIFCSPHIGHO2_12_FULL_37_14]
MNDKNHGFILLIMLIFMQIFSLIVLAELMSIKLNLKLARDRWQKTNNLLMSNAFLHKIENNLIFTIPSCVQSALSPQFLINRSTEWWGKFACASNHTTLYHYVIEKLGNDPCALIRIIDKNHTITADYYRITLLFQSSAPKSFKIILQSTIVRPKTSTQACTEIPHQVKIGRQVYRELL